MVTTEYCGRTGNNLFQYVFARLLAERNGLCLGSGWTGELFEATEPVDGVVSIKNFTLIRDWYEDDHNDSSAFWVDYKGRNVHCKGFFQNPKYYEEFREKIRGYFKTRYKRVHPDDYVIHLRFGDYWDKKVRSVIHPQWHKQALDAMGYSPSRHRLYLVYDARVGDPRSFTVLKAFNQYGPIHVNGSVNNDFAVIAGAGNVVCSNSSFCWWACFLGDPAQVVTFERWMRFTTVPLAHTLNWKVMKGKFYA